MQELDELDSQVSQIIKQLELKFGDVVTYKVSATSFFFQHVGKPFVLIPRNRTHSALCQLLYEKAGDRVLGLGTKLYKSHWYYIRKSFIQTC